MPYFLTVFGPVLSSSGYLNCLTLYDEVISRSMCDNYQVHCSIALTSGYGCKTRENNEIYNTCSCFC